MKTLLIHATLYTVPDTEEAGNTAPFHATFMASFNDDLTPRENTRNMAITQFQKKWPQQWKDRQRLEVYRFDDDGNEVMMHVIEKQLETTKNESNETQKLST